MRCGARVARGRGVEGDGSMSVGIQELCVEYIYTHIYTYVHTYVHTYIHTYIHTSICSNRMRLCAPRSRYVGVHMHGPIDPKKRRCGAGAAGGGEEHVVNRARVANTHVHV